MSLMSLWRLPEYWWYKTLRREGGVGWRSLLTSLTAIWFHKSFKKIKRQLIAWWNCKPNYISFRRIVKMKMKMITKIRVAQNINTDVAKWVVIQNNTHIKRSISCFSRGLKMSTLSTGQLLFFTRPAKNYKTLDVRPGAFQRLLSWQWYTNDSQTSTVYLHVYVANILSGFAEGWCLSVAGAKGRSVYSQIKHAILRMPCMNPVH